MKIGVLGGTFNPVHIGHLINAAIAVEELKLDRLLFIPARIPVHKGEQASIPAEDRYAMLFLAIRDDTRFEISRMELDREEPSYSVITLRELVREHSGDEIFLIIGADSFNELHTWKDYRELVRLATIAVMMRPNITPKNPLLEEADAKYVLLHNPLVEVSSTAIRNRIRTGRSIRYMVPKPVEEYITKKELYRD